MARRDLLDERQPEADAAGLLGVAGQAKERLEDALAHRLGNARTAIADLERDEVAAAHRDVAEADLDLAAAVALRVLEQVADGAAQQPLVAVDVDAARALHVGTDARRLLRGDREQVDPVVMERVLGDVEPARQQHLLDQAIELGDVLVDLALQRVAFGRRRFGEHRDGHLHSRQR